MTSIIVSGYTLPFYPMRPRTGRRLTRQNIDEFIDSMISQEYFPQKKLNGDRAILAVQDGKVHVANRHGSWFKHTVNNKNSWLKAGDQTLLDGEVWKKIFYPFEALSVNGVNMMNARPAERADAAKELCLKLEQNWIYTFPDPDWLKRLDENTPDFEGVVLKLSNSPYIPLGGENQESDDWFKRRW